jgi:hypothetical protein
VLPRGALRPRSRRQATNVLRGTYDGRAALVFDYSFVTQTHNGQQVVQQTHRYCVAALRLPAPLPRLELTAETPLTRLAGALGRDDLALESEDFNRRYGCARRTAGSPTRCCTRGRWSSCSPRHR